MKKTTEQKQKEQGPTAFEERLERLELIIDLLGKIMPSKIVSLICQKYNVKACTARRWVCDARLIVKSGQDPSCRQHIDDVWERMIHGQIQAYFDTKTPQPVRNQIFKQFCFINGKINQPQHAQQFFDPAAEDELVEDLNAPAPPPGPPSD